jgi:predicted  nucleic acid-binding Zn-ribbon protein
MVDTESVLLNVQEREKWRRRMDSLDRTLNDLRSQRRRAESRLRRVRDEITRLQAAADAVVEFAGRPQPGRTDARQGIPLTYR